MRAKSMFLFFGLFLFLFGCGGGGGGPEPVKNTSIPYVKSFTPGNGFTNVATNTVIEVVFSEPINPESVNAANFDVRSSGHVIAATYEPAEGNTKVIIKSNGSLAIKTTYTVTVKDVKSVVGVTSAAQSWSFTTDVASQDVTPPIVTSFTPGSGDTNIKFDTMPMVTFSETIDPATVIVANVKLKKGDEEIPGVPTVNANKVTFKSNASLAANSTYTMHLSGLKDLAGNVISTQINWSFSTGANSSGSTDSSAPVVTSFSPATNAPNVGLNSTVTATFSKSMDTASVINNFKLAIGNTAVPATVTMSGLTATLTPSAALAVNTTYTATVSGAKDVDGHTMSTITTWSFTTGTSGGSTTGGTSSSPAGATVIDPKGIVAYAWMDSTTLVIWVKKGANVNAPKPFIIGTFNNWLKKELPPFDANGWSSINITITQPTTIAFSYGYDYGSGHGVLPNGSETWASDMIQLSSYYKATPNNLQALAANNTVTPVP